LRSRLLAEPATPLRYFADAGALYSYEGTREINQLIVGRAITGEGAFVQVVRP
jgi:alkylation response protein AidB-like acyl-CoA dehydrogenase